jgi:hypothetical protein
MTNDVFLIKNMMMNMAELGAATIRKFENPIDDLLTQRQAYRYFATRDKKFGEKNAHGEAWVKNLVKDGILNHYRKGNSKNSPKMYSKAELIAAYNAEYAAKYNIFDGLNIA